MYLSIFAGMMIGIGGFVNLSVGGALGAILFSLGLLTILSFGFELFTGKAGLLATNDITGGKLASIWFGNFIGTYLIALGLSLTPGGISIAEGALDIVAIRNSNGHIANLAYGIGCGMLMYIAVSLYKI